jgi:hypothetical protein
LDIGLNTRQIYEDHKKVFFNARALGIKPSRDDHLNMKSTQYNENKMRRGTWKRHNNDMTSVHRGQWTTHIMFSSGGKKKIKG